MTGRRHLVLGCLALLLVLPGCLTRALWRDRTWRTPVYEDAQVTFSGTVAVDPDAPGELLLAGPAGGWRLAPRTGGEVAQILLADGPLPVTHLHLRLLEQFEGEQLRGVNAELTMALGLPADGLHQIDGAVPAAWTAALRPAAHGDASAGGAGHGVSLPPILAETVQRLAGRDLARLLQADTPAVMAAFAWVDRAGHPLSLPEVRQCLGREASDPSAALAQRLQAIRPLWLALSCEHAGGRTSVLVRADLAWLLGTLEGGDAGWTHASHWGGIADVAQGEGRGQPITVDRVRRERSFVGEPNRYLQVLVTPFAVVGDLAFGFVVGLVQVLFDVDDDEWH